MDVDEEDFLKYTISLWFWSTNLTSKVFTLWNKYVNYKKQKRAKKEGNEIIGIDLTRVLNGDGFHENENNTHLGDACNSQANKLDLLVKCIDINLYDKADVYKMDYSSKNSDNQIITKSTLEHVSTRNVFCFKEIERYDQMNVFLTKDVMGVGNDEKFLLANHITLAEDIKQINLCNNCSYEIEDLETKSAEKISVADSIATSGQNKNNSPESVCDCTDDVCCDSNTENIDDPLINHLWPSVAFEGEDKSDGGDESQTSAVDFGQSASDDSDYEGDKGASSSSIISSHVENVSESVAKENDDNVISSVNSDSTGSDRCLVVDIQISHSDTSHPEIRHEKMLIREECTQTDGLLCETMLDSSNKVHLLDNSDTHLVTTSYYPALIPPDAFQSSGNVMGGVRLSYGAEVNKATFDVNSGIKVMPNDINKRSKYENSKEPKSYTPENLNDNANNVQFKFNYLIDLSRLIYDRYSHDQVKNGCRLKSALGHANADPFPDSTSKYISGNFFKQGGRMKRKFLSFTTNDGSCYGDFTDPSLEEAKHPVFNQNNNIPCVFPSNLYQKADSFHDGHPNVRSKRTSPQSINPMNFSASSNDTGLTPPAERKALNSSEASSRSESTKDIQSHGWKYLNRSDANLSPPEPLEEDRKETSRHKDIEELKFIKKQLVHFQDISHRLKHLVEARERLIMMLNSAESRISSDVSSRAHLVLEKLDEEISSLQLQKSDKKSICLLLAKKARDLIHKIGL